MYTYLYTAWSKRQYLVLLAQAQFCRALQSQLTFHRWVNTPDWTSNWYPHMLWEGATDAPMSYLKGLRGLCFKCLNCYNPLFAKNKREKSTCTLLTVPVALQKRLLAPTGLPMKLGKRIAPDPPGPCLLVGYMVHSWIVNWEGVPWTLQSGFQPKLGLRLQILPFVQPSCT